MAVGSVVPCIRHSVSGAQREFRIKFSFIGQILELTDVKLLDAFKDQQIYKRLQYFSIQNAKLIHNCKVNLRIPSTFIKSPIFLVQIDIFRLVERTFS